MKELGNSTIALGGILKPHPELSYFPYLT